MKRLGQARHDAARLWRLCVVNGGPDPNRVREVVKDVIGSHRTGALTILSTFLRLLKHDRARRVAEVDSVVPLDYQTRVTVESALARRYGHPMKATYVIDPALIGGFRLKVASDVYDDSVRARLTALEARF